MAVTLSEVAKLYVATFNRAPDAAGMNYWVNSGMSIEQIAQSFFDQSETQTLYPTGTSSSSFVTSVYDNLFNRTPDTEGLNYWVQQLDSNAVSKQNFILAVVNGALNSDATILDNKKSVGLDFVSKGLNDTSLAKNVMQNVNESSSSVTSALNQINNYTPPATLETLVGHYTLSSAIISSTGTLLNTNTDGTLDIFADGAICMQYTENQSIWSTATNSYIPGKIYADGEITSVDSNFLHLAPYYFNYFHSPAETEYTGSDLENEAFISANFETYSIDRYIKYTLTTDTLKLTTASATYTFEIA